MPNDSNRPDVAVFIDFENVYVSVRDKLDANPNFESIMERCEDFGRVVIARAYADWYRYPRVTSALYANGIEPMYVPTYHYDRDLGRTGRPIKNSVDMNLCVEAMKTLYTNPNIAKFVLATGDRDFIPLVNTIRQQGKEVIIIGIGGAASAHLAQSADEFIFYETLVGKKTGGTVDDVPRAKMPEKGRESYEFSGEETPAAAPRRDRERDTRPSEPIATPAYANGNGNGNGEATSAATPPAAPSVIPAEPNQPDIYDTLVKAIHLARERGYVCSFGSLKLLMKELMGGDFRESRYKDAQGRPFAKFKDFVMEAERRGKVQVFTNGTVNEVFLPGEDPYKLSQFAAELKVDPDALSATSEEVAEPRAETKLASSPGNRRRRRRRSGRGIDRKTDGELATDNAEELEESEEYEEEEFADALPDLPDLMDEAAAAEVFEELLDRIESEDAQIVTLADTDPEPILEPETSQIEAADALALADYDEVVLAEDAYTAQPLVDIDFEPVAAVSEQPSALEAITAVGRPFDEQDWQFLRDVLTNYNRPASFAQIHDLLRNARNELSVSRTNEELRSLVKQAINSGILARQGKGSRVTYRVAGDAVPPETEYDADQMSVVEQVQSEPIDDVTLVQAADATDTVAATESTGSALLDALEDAADLASNPAEARAEVADMQQQATAIALEPDSDISGGESTEAAPTAKRTTRRHKPAEATAEQAPTEEPATKRPSRRKPVAKAADAEAPTDAAPAKRSTRRKPQQAEE